ncbi:MAG: restriction endonuclease subunit S [Thiotrichales bacterium]|nr:restriction endonuclease subunit S [Thiotrichales bacterium]
MGWPAVPLGEFLVQSENRVEPKPDKTYKQVTARLWGRGLKLRGRILGSRIAASRQVQVREGQFLLSRIDARNGAFGLVPADLDGALVSSDFPAFDVDETRADPRYLAWYSKTDGFVDLCRRASEGSTNRVRLREGRFLAMEVPLPPLGEQRWIVDRLDRATDLVERRRRAMAASERDIAALLRKAFNEITEGADHLPMAKVAPLVRRPVDVQPDESYPELGVRSFGRGTFHKPALEGVAVGSKKLYRIEPQDLVFNIVFAWEGAVAIAQAKDEGRVGSHRFLTCVPDPEIATVDFLLYFLLTPEGLRSLGEASPGGAGRNRTLGLKKLAAIEVPVPPIEKQHWFDGLQAKVRALRRTHVKTTADLDSLVPAILHEMFSGDSGRSAVLPSMEF